MGAIYWYVADFVHGLAKNGHPEQFFFGDPAEIMGKIPLKGKDIVLTAVVAGKNIGLVRIDITKPFHLDPNAREQT